MVLVDVYIPSVDETYDFMLDENIESDKIILEIYEMISKKMNSKPEKDVGGFWLYHMTTGKIIEKMHTLAQSGVKDGSRLMLV